MGSKRSPRGTHLVDLARLRAAVRALANDGQSELEAQAGLRLASRPWDPAQVAPATVTQVFNTTVHAGQVSVACGAGGDVTENVSQTTGNPRTIADVAATLRRTV
jgi:hypothetical protein